MAASLREALADKCRKLRPSLEYWVASEKFLTHLNQTLSADCRSSAIELRPYASYAQKTCLVGESIDVALVVSGGFPSSDGVLRVPHATQVANLKRVAEVFKDDQFGPVWVTSDGECTAQSPLLHLSGRFREGREHTISLTARLVVRDKSAGKEDDLIRKLLDLDTRCQLLVFLVKHWATCRRVHDVRKGFLSLTTWTVLAIFTMQRLGFLPPASSLETGYPANQKPASSSDCEAIVVKALLSFFDNVLLLSQPEFARSAVSIGAARMVARSSIIEAPLMVQLPTDDTGFNLASGLSEKGWSDIILEVERARNLLRSSDGDAAPLFETRLVADDVAPWDSTKQDINGWNTSAPEFQGYYHTVDASSAGYPTHPTWPLYDAAFDMLAKPSIYGQQAQPEVSSKPEVRRLEIAPHLGKRIEIAAHLPPPEMNIPVNEVSGSRDDEGETDLELEDGPLYKRSWLLQLRSTAGKPKFDEINRTMYFRLRGVDVSEIAEAAAARLKTKNERKQNRSQPPPITAAKENKQGNKQSGDGDGENDSGTESEEVLLQPGDIIYDTPKLKDVRNLPSRGLCLRRIDALEQAWEISKLPDEREASLPKQTPPLKVQIGGNEADDLGPCCKWVVNDTWEAVRMERKEDGADFDLTETVQLSKDDADGVSLKEWEGRLNRREKQVQVGKNTAGYRGFREWEKMHGRQAGDPQTPRVAEQCSKRQFDGRLSHWRILLHAFSPRGNGEEENQVKQPQATIKEKPAMADVRDNASWKRMQ